MACVCFLSSFLYSYNHPLFFRRKQLFSPFSCLLTGLAVGELTAAKKALAAAKGEEFDDGKKKKDDKPKVDEGIQSPLVLLAHEFPTIHPSSLSHVCSFFGSRLLFVTMNRPFQERSA